MEVDEVVFPGGAEENQYISYIGIGTVPDPLEGLVHIPKRDFHKVI